MSGTTTINGIPWPELTDAPNIETAVKPAVDHIDTRIIPRFVNTTARNAAIPAPIAGQVCWVDSLGLQKYSDDWYTVHGIGVPRVSAYQTVAQQMFNETGAAITCAGETYKSIASMHSNVTNTSRLTAPQDGLYVVSGSVGFEANATGYRQVGITKNVEATELARRRYPSVGAAHASICEVRQEVVLAAGDFVQLYAYHNAGVTLLTEIFSSYTHFAMRLITD